MRRISLFLISAIAVAFSAFWLLTAPPPLDDSASLPAGDAENGALVFAAAGCASCHKAPGGDRQILAGGEAFASDFGTFYAPNISSDPTHGIGAWQDAALLRAITQGVSPDGRYYYPAFPSHAYARATRNDMLDLIAYLRSLPPDASPSRQHDLSWPFTMRRTLPLWRMLFTSSDWVMPAESAELERGRYLVEALGHCAECHTPRNALGGLDRQNWMAGAPLPSGKGRVPGLSPETLDWSAKDIAEYLSSGFTPDYDVAGGKMVDVIENTSLLFDSDLAAMAAYIKALP